MGYLKEKYPIFATNLVAYFVNFIVSNIIGILVKQTALAVYFNEVDKVTSRQLSEFVEAINQQKMGAPDADTQVKAAFKRLIRLPD